MWAEREEINLHSTNSEDISLQETEWHLSMHAYTHTQTHTHTHPSSDLQREEWVKRADVRPASGTGLSFHGLWASPCGLPHTESIILSKGLSWKEDSPALVETVLPMRASGSIRWHDTAGLHGIHTDEETQKKTGHLATGAMRSSSQNPSGLSRFYKL